MATIELVEATANLSELLDCAQRGEEVVISRSGTPVAKIVPVASDDLGRAPPRHALLGALKGKMWVSDDFDAPLPPELQAYFDGEIDDLTDKPVKAGR